MKGPHLYARIVVKASNLLISRCRYAEYRRKHVLKHVPHVQQDYVSSFKTISLFCVVIPIASVISLGPYCCLAYDEEIHLMCACHTCITISPVVVVHVRLRRIRLSSFLKAPANEETLFRKRCFPKYFVDAQTKKHLLRKVSNIFLSKFRNIFSSQEANLTPATNVSWGRKRGNICFRDIVSS